MELSGLTVSQSRAGTELRLSPERCPAAAAGLYTGCFQVLGLLLKELKKYTQNAEQQKMLVRSEMKYRLETLRDGSGHQGSTKRQSAGRLPGSSFCEPWKRAICLVEHRWFSVLFVGPGLCRPLSTVPALFHDTVDACAVTHNTKMVRTFL